MKYLIILLAGYVLCSCSKPVKGKNGVVYKNPVQYNDYIVSRQTQVIRDMLVFGEVVEQNLDSARVLLDGYVDNTHKLILDLQEMPAYRGDSTFRDAAINSFRFYKKLFDEDCRRIVDIRKKGESMTSQDAVEVNRMVENLTREEKKHDSVFRKAQLDFANKNKIELRDNEIQQEINDKKNAN